MFRSLSPLGRRTAAVLGLGFSLAAITPATAAPATDVNGRYTAKEIHTFLDRFYGEHGPSAADRRNRVSDLLKEKAAANPGFDVLLCAQNTPRSIDIGKVTTAQSARVGWATVTTHWGENGEVIAELRALVDLD
ncbi:hypothetical protein ACFQ6Q_39405, partial [Streptomyces sp. NPDC056437]|uniref:hypothetical protein n=1 Tax=Streptomyces sp. NPDC056437 TaxID=3345816 RepID=UPI0036C81555